jgi:hypothetical protein
VRCALLERHEQIHHGPDVRTSIGEVTGLNEHGLSNCPSPGAVKQMRVSQDAHQRVEIPMDIADGYHTLGSGGCRLQ